MTIDRLGGIDPVSKANETARNNRATRKGKPDSVNVSSEAQKMSAVYHATEVVASAPDVRMDRVEEVRQKLQDPDYIDDQVVEAVADGIMENFGL